MMPYLVRKRLHRLTWHGLMPYLVRKRLHRLTWHGFQHPSSSHGKPKI